jgi:hypothetical protein
MLRACGSSTPHFTDGADQLICCWCRVRQGAAAAAGLTDPAILRCMPRRWVSAEGYAFNAYSLAELQGGVIDCSSGVSSELLDVLPQFLPNTEQAWKLACSCIQPAALGAPPSPWATCANETLLTAGCAGSMFQSIMWADGLCPLSGQPAACSADALFCGRSNG